MPNLDNNDPKFQDIIFKKEFNSNQLFLDSTGIDDLVAKFMIKLSSIVLKNFMTKDHHIRVY